MWIKFEGPGMGIGSVVHFCGGGPKARSSHTAVEHQVQPLHPKPCPFSPSDRDLLLSHSQPFVPKTFFVLTLHPQPCCFSPPAPFCKLINS